MSKLAPDARDLLLRLGVGQYNATQIIPTLFYGPPQSDPDMPPVILIVQAIQRNLNLMGAKLPVDGHMTPRTVLELRKICGTEWPRLRWYEILQQILTARENGMMLQTDVVDARPMRRGAALGLSDPFPMPGGIWGWLALFGAGYLYLTNQSPKQALSRLRSKPSHKATTKRA